MTEVKTSGTVPTKGRPEDAAYDLRSAQMRVIPPGGWNLVKTGFQMALPKGMAGLVCSRSGLALKHGISVLNAPGIVDPGYTGDVGVILHNAGTEPFIVNKGDRIAQLMLIEYSSAVFKGIKEAEELEPTGVRGTQGFGSSGLA